MKLFKKVFFGLVIFLLIVFAGLSFYIKVYAKDAVTGALSSSLERDVQIQNLQYEFPLGLLARDLVIVDVMTAKEVSTQFSPESIWTFLSTPDQEWKISKLQIRKGSVEYFKSLDYKFAFSLENVFLTAEDIIFPLKPVHTNFHLTGILDKDKFPLSGSRVEGAGWIDLIQKDMSSRFKVLEKDDRAGLTANIVSKNNQMRVEGDIQVRNLSFTPETETQEESVQNMIFGALSSMGVAIGAKYSFETKMDDFKISNISFSGNVSTR